jgi:predicted DNA-binding transcriptional regulator YafY
MRADRLLSLLLLLQSRASLTAQEAAQSLGVSVRTLYRDMDALQRVGVPITATAGPNGGYSVLPGYRSVLSGFSSDEIGALMAAASSADLHELGLTDVLNRAIIRLASYSRDQRRVVAANPDVVLLDGTPWEPTDKSVVLGDLIDAISARRIVNLEISATPYGGTRKRLEVMPAGVVHKEAQWYLVYRTGTYRVVGIDQVRAVTPAETRYPADPTFNLKQFWTHWCEDAARGHRRFSVKLALRPDTAATVRGFLAGAGVQALNQSLPPASTAFDTETDITVTANFGSFEEARAAILGLGGAARVVEPDALRLSIIDFATQAQRANRTIGLKTPVS